MNRGWLLGAWVVALSAFAQVDQTSPRALWLLGADLHTRGVGGVVEVFWHRRDRTNWLTAWRLSTFKDPREIKITNQFVNRRTLPYVYGKQYYVALNTLSVGRRRIIAQGNDPMSVTVASVWQVGAAAAVLIPVYLEIIHYDPVTQQVDYREERFDPVLHVDQRFIAGGVSWTRGIKEATWMPGLYGQAALQFDLPGYWALRAAVRMGAEVMAFPAPLPVMAYVANDQLILTLFLGVRLFEL